ncbi:nucleotidyl transferase AbiEii/AbiGii toxin family protein [Streptomyces benahoarensis]|uniref:Nucleotidyl transferase AbiEii/AbiGii toxin family protein n=1 Tax=Streptomyces benahoarensis TaxID=2595054 RepID=A0A553ZMM7_9ACTN|nr:nucleotidyl transferase AbiEii/AbiGii toxin family protein [Streptomyces benahoarensis]TSB32005.1 nucleotidyl transferase AbiEii/AbiGii toxin family protein [Streptomyces benahoarensis]TSB42731.1 nucleotidyl transferase AbiEii/AbiGii toxin family protein [Streptomyces benahoarensis]
MARDTYATPAAFYGALKHKAQLMARSEGVPVADVLSSFFFSRLVARVFHAQPDAWIVKGGHALLMRYAAAARLSRDIDIQRSAGGEIGEAVADFLKAAAHDLDDYMSFTPTRTSMHENGAAGAKQIFRVHVGTHEVGVVKVDVVTGHAPSAAPDVRRIAPLIDLAWPADWPKARLYPIVNHLADKVCAMYERHQGSPSSRYRDLADILLISQRENVDGRYAQLALRTEARLRRLTRAPGVDLVLPSAFQPPGPAWPDRYPAAARQVPGLQGCITWKEAAMAAEASSLRCWPQARPATGMPQRPSGKHGPSRMAPGCPVVTQSRPIRSLRERVNGPRTCLLPRGAPDRRLSPCAPTSRPLPPGPVRHPAGRTAPGPVSQDRQMCVVPRSDQWP